MRCFVRCTVRAARWNATHTGTSLRSGKSHSGEVGRKVDILPGLVPLRPRCPQFQRRLLGCHLAHSHGLSLFG